MIYTPRSMIDAILRDEKAGRLTNPQVCTKIEFRGYEISIAMDSSIGPGDLKRGDIRIYKDDEEVTKDLFPNDAMLYGEGEVLKNIFDVLSKMVLLTNERRCRSCNGVMVYPQEPGEWEYNEFNHLPADKWQRAQIRRPAVDDTEGQDGMRFHPYFKDGVISEEPCWWPKAQWRPYKGA